MTDGREVQCPHCQAEFTIDPSDPPEVCPACGLAPDAEPAEESPVTESAATGQEGNDEGSPGIGERFWTWFTNPDGLLGIAGRGLLVLIVIGLLLTPFSGPADDVDQDSGSSGDGPEAGTGDSTDGSGNGGADNGAPTAAFTVSCNDLSCRFDASDSSDPEDNITQYQWSLGDKNVTTGVTVNHTYAEGGTYAVELTVFDPYTEDQTSQLVEVVGPPPDPLYFEGSGDTATEFFTTEQRLLKVELRHDGSSNFIVWLKNSAGEKEKLFANEIGTYDGNRYFGVTPGDYLLDIQADGQWNITLRQPRPQDPDPAPVTFSGDRDNATAFFETGQRLLEVEMSHAGSSNFIVWLYDADGNQVMNFANVIGDYQGSRYFNPDPGVYVLDVVADGAWTIDISEPSPTTGETPPVSLSGSGDTAAQVLDLQAGSARFEMTHDGDSNFIVWLYDEVGSEVALLANEIGQYDASTVVNIPSDGFYFLDIVADGAWTIDASQ